MFELLKSFYLRTNPWLLANKPNITPFCDSRPFSQESTYNIAPILAHDDEANDGTESQVDKNKLPYKAVKPLLKQDSNANLSTQDSDNRNITVNTFVSIKLSTHNER